MRNYTFKQIRAIQAENEFKFAALENSDGKKIILFNTSPTAKTKILEQLDIIEKRLKSSTLQDGYYFILFCNSIQQCKKDYEKFAVLKGKAEDAAPIQNAVLIQEKSENVLTYEAALNYQKEIAQLQFDKQILEGVNDDLKTKLDELRKELGERGEAENSAFSEKNVSSFFESIIPLADRFFDMEEKKLNALANKKTATRPLKKLIRVGTAEHLKLIQDLYDTGKDNEFNAQMDLLEKNNKELYNDVLTELGMTEEEENEEQEQEETNQE